MYCLLTPSSNRYLVIVTAKASSRRSNGHNLCSRNWTGVQNGLSLLRWYLRSSDVAEIFEKSIRGPKEQLRNAEFEGTRGRSQPQRVGSERLFVRKTRFRKFWSLTSGISSSTHRSRSSSEAKRSGTSFLLVMENLLLRIWPLEYCCALEAYIDQSIGWMSSLCCSFRPRFESSVQEILPSCVW